MRHRFRRIALLATVAVLALWAAVPASSVTTTVTLADVSGSRTLTVTDATGTDLDAATISTGAGASVPFVTNVTDLLYDNVAYSVDASLSNLYLDDGLGGYDCAVYIPSGELSISWPTEAFGVDDIEALVTDALFDASGTLITSGVGALDTILETATGLTIGDAISATDISRSGQGLVQSTLSDVTLASALTGEVLDELPLQISVGAAGAFTDAADHSTCSGGAGTPTSINLQSGDANGTLDLVELSGEVETALADVDGAVSGGHLTEDEVLQGLFGSDLTAIETAVASAGLGATWDAYVDTLITSLSLDDVSISTLVGQTGTYTSVPALDVDTALNVTGTPPTGVVNAYEGELVITLTSS